MTDKIAEIKARHEQVARNWAVTEDEGYAAHVDRVTLLAEVERTRREAERMRAERDTLLLDARELVRWCVKPTFPPDHPLCVIIDRLNAHADTLDALDAAKTKTDKEDGR